jgi:acyl-CoA synthetase (AMP-forming)/AMP-acid ligase II
MGIHRSSDTTAPTVQAAFALAARWKGDAELLVDDVDRLTGLQSIEAVARLAGGLAAHGVGKGTTVAFLCGASVRHAVAFFASQWLGAIACALHVRELPARLAETVDWLDAEVLITDQALRGTAARVASESRRAVALVDLGAGAGTGPTTSHDSDYADLLAANPIEPASVTPHDPAVIILSSGTTGEPKGAVHTQATLFAGSRVGPFVYGAIEPSDSVVVAMAPSFAAWLIVVLPHLAARARIVFSRAFDPVEFVDLIAREHVGLASLVPTMWRMILASDPLQEKLAHLKSVFYSGEPGTPDLVAAMSERLCTDVRTAYLSSEGGAASAVAAGSATLLAASKAATTGKPIPGADLRVVAIDGSVNDILPPGETGEILTRSASMAEQYWKDPVRTAERFVEGWWRSGDLGWIDADGDLFVVGRTDNVINSGGIKVHAEEVEAALSRHPAVAMAAVVGVPDATLGQRIEAHLVLRDTTIDPQVVVAWCGAQGLLPRIKLPKTVFVRDALPTGPTGKLFRRGLRGTM